MGIVTFLASRSSTADKTQKYAYKLAKKRARFQMENILSKKEQLQTTEHPRQEAFMKQSMFGRGLGKSTIAQQEQGRLKDIQSRQIAAIDRDYELARMGLSLIKKRYRTWRRTRWAQGFDEVLGLAGGTVGVISATQGGDNPGSQGSATAGGGYGYGTYA